MFVGSAGWPQRTECGVVCWICWLAACIKVCLGECFVLMLCRRPHHQDSSFCGSKSKCMSTRPKTPSAQFVCVESGDKGYSFFQGYVAHSTNPGQTWSRSPSVHSEPHLPVAAPRDRQVAPLDLAEEAGDTLAYVLMPSKKRTETQACWLGWLYYTNGKPWGCSPQWSQLMRTLW